MRTVEAQALAPKLRVVGVAPGITMVSGDQTGAPLASTASPASNNIENLIIWSPMSRPLRRAGVYPLFPVRSLQRRALRIEALQRAIVHQQLSIDPDMRHLFPACCIDEM